MIVIVWLNLTKKPTTKINLSFWQHTQKDDEHVASKVIYHYCNGGKKIHATCGEYSIKLKNEANNPFKWRKKIKWFTKHLNLSNWLRCTFVLSG